MAAFQSTNIKTPGPHDILCGRGGGTNAHPGNIKFRKLVAARKLRYLAVSKRDKPGVAHDVMREWRALDPPGRFLAKGADPGAAGGDSDGDGGGSGGAWHDIGDKKAREKVSQCLRERSGAANEAVNALVETVKASGVACPEDYATLMNLAAQVRERNGRTIRQQGELIQQWEQWQQYLNGNAAAAKLAQGTGDGGLGGGYVRKAFKPTSLQQPQDQHSSLLGGDSIGDGVNFGSPREPTENVSGAEIQRLLWQRQRLLDPQSSMDDGSVRRGYESLMQKQLDLNRHSGKTMSFTDGGEVARNNSDSSQVLFDSGGMNAAGNNGGLGSGASPGGQMAVMLSQMDHNAAENYMTRLRMLRQGGGEGDGSGGSSNSEGNTNNTPDQIAAGISNVGNQNNELGVGVDNKALMSNQTRVMGNVGSNSEVMGGVGGNNTAIGSNNTMGSNNGNSTQQQQMQGGNLGKRTLMELTMEECQASLREFLSHNDDFGDCSGAGGNSGQPGNVDPQPLSPVSAETQRADNWRPTRQYIEIPTKTRDGPRGGPPCEPRRTPAAAELLSARDTFQSVTSSSARRSFQSLDDMDIRGTFHSIDTIDMASISCSISEVMDADLQQRQETKKKCVRRLSNVTVLSRYGTQPEARAEDGDNQNSGPEVRTTVQAIGILGQMLEGKTVDRENKSSPDRGPKKVRTEQEGGQGKDQGEGGVGNQAKGTVRQTIQTENNDEPPARRRSSILSIKDLNLDGGDSIGNMSVMSDMTDFLDLMQPS